VPWQVQLVALLEALLEELREGPLVVLLEVQWWVGRLEVQSLWSLPHRVKLIQLHHLYQRWP
jgi:hypothetical protein